jgi:transcriptional antiterminator RfaH
MVTSYEEENWHVIFTMPKREKIVHQCLQRNSINSFLPLVKEIRRWSDRKKKIEVPCFPNYLFVKILSKERFKVFDVPGVVRFVGFNNRPSIVSQEEIDLIQKALSCSSVTVIDNARLQRGSRVMINSGPLRGIEGVLVETKGSKRLILEVKSINRSMIVDVFADNIELTPCC